MVDEGAGGVLRSRRVSRADSARVAPYPYPFSRPPSTPSSTAAHDPAEDTTSTSLYSEVVDFEGPRSRHTNWTKGKDGAIWWSDKRTGQGSLSPISNEQFTVDEAEGSYSYADQCIYLTPGQVEFRHLKPEHRAVFEKARKKEVQSLLDNKAIKIFRRAVNSDVNIQTMF